MSSRDEEWWDLQAGELVLGTLDDHERDLFESIRKRDPEFQYRVSEWETRFAPLDRSLSPVNPPQHVWQAIESDLGIRISPAQPGESILNQTAALEQVQDAFKLEEVSSDFMPESESATVATDDTSTLAASEHRPAMTRPNVNIWRDLTLLATAACLVLGFIAWNAQYEKGRTSNVSQAQPAEYDNVGVVLSEESEPLWIINAATASQALKVSALAAVDPGADQAYELWMVKADDGFSTMGLLPVVAGKTINLQAPELSKDVIAFRISLEPAGGSPNATPTGPVVFQGDLQKLDLAEPDLAEPDLAEPDLAESGKTL